MKVVNIHQRIIHQPKEKVAELLSTLATRNDKIWPSDAWPPMKLDRGLQVGSKGGHGPIRYTVRNYIPGSCVQFEFTRPKGFHGSHWFEVIPTGNSKTKLRHTIEMNVTGRDLLSWIVAIRWLHDALVEDAFDKVENHFSPSQKDTPWNLWVKVLRGLFSISFR